MSYVTSQLIVLGGIMFFALIAVVYHTIAIRKMKRRR